MKYYFLPGRYFELSFAEITAVAPEYISEYKISQIGSKLILLETEEDVVNLFDRLGGFLSYGLIISEISELFEGLDAKIVFGVNVFGTLDVKKIYEEIKDQLKEKGITGKYPSSDTKILNAGQILKNKILEKGFLLEIVEVEGETIFGKCLKVQDIERFSKIEYDKPYTDKKMGVIPSKLARIMVNLSGVKEGSTLWDPFCGSGTILLEGFALGVNTIGSDISQKAVEMATENVRWLGNELGDKQTKYNIFKFDVLNPDSRIHSLLRNTQIDAVVCEPFMGPPQLKAVSLSRAKQLLEVVTRLYGSLFRLLERCKLNDFRMVLILPSYKTKKGWVTTSLSQVAGKKWEIENKRYGGDLHWERENSIIRRNIFILRKKF